MHGLLVHTWFLFTWFWVHSLIHVHSFVTNFQKEEEYKSYARPTLVIISIGYLKARYWFYSDRPHAESGITLARLNTRNIESYPINALPDTQALLRNNEIYNFGDTSLSWNHINSTPRHVGIFPWNGATGFLLFPYIMPAYLNISISAPRYLHIRI